MVGHSGTIGPALHLGTDHRLGWRGSLANQTSHEEKPTKLRNVRTYGLSSQLARILGWVSEFSDGYNGLGLALEMTVIATPTLSKRSTQGQISARRAAALHERSMRTESVRSH